jgi:uncharacterized coiled-coil protein SlyX
MDDRFNRLEEKIDKIDDKLAKTNEILAAQHVSLEMHMKRTDLLEQKLEPVERHVAAVHTILKFIGLISVFATILDVIGRLVFKW